MLPWVVLELPVCPWFDSQTLPEAEAQTAEAISGGATTDDNALVEAVKAARQQANQVWSLVI